MKQEKKIVLSTQGYRGTRDFYPDDMRLRKFLYEKIHKSLKSFGYEEYDGPLVESLELYAAKTSEEIVKEQLYSFLDRGERNLAIRPEMTPTLARMVAAKFHELQKPIRWYSIPTCMRFERPQRGRLREFNQLNVDLFGGNPIDEDVEIILTIVEILNSLGASTEDFEILVNHRGLVNDFLTLILPSTSTAQNSLHSTLLRLFDKRDKLSAEEFHTECAKLNLNESQISKIDHFLNADLTEISKFFDDKNEFVDALKQRFELLNSLVKGSCIKFSPAITRGFDYYTGIVFEVFDKNPENRRALFGGGRFDNLVSAFGVPHLPGVGYGVSDVALINFLTAHNLSPVLNKNIDICVLRFQESDRSSQFSLAQLLRKEGMSVECIIADGKFGKQIAHANKIGAKSIAFRGETEIKNNTFIVKWLLTGEQMEYAYSVESVAQLLKYIRE